MRTLLARSVVVLAFAASLLGVAPAAQASGSASLSTYCSSFVQSSDGHTVSAVCNGPGKEYYFQAYFCSTSTCRWQSSAWTTDGRRATISSGGYVGGIGRTIYYR